MEIPLVSKSVSDVAARLSVMPMDAVALDIDSRLWKNSAPVFCGVRQES